MKTLEDIIKLCKDEAGKIFVMDEKGDLQLVIMGSAEYGRIKNQESRIKNEQVQLPDPEVVNREILKAQLGEQQGRRASSAAAAEDALLQRARVNPYQPAPPPEIRSNGLPKQRDLREEVIDPSFDFDAPEEI